MSAESAVIAARRPPVAALLRPRRARVTARNAAADAKGHARRGYAFQRACAPVRRSRGATVSDTVTAVAATNGTGRTLGQDRTMSKRDRRAMADTVGCGRGFDPQQFGQKNLKLQTGAKPYQPDDSRRRWRPDNGSTAAYRTGRPRRGNDRTRRSAISVGRSGRP